MDDLESLSGLNIELIIISGRNLAPMDRSFIGLGKPITSDPFVEVWFGGEFIGKTHVVKKTVSPTWNKYFKIELGPEDVQNIEHGQSRFEYLSLRIFDYDRLKQNDFMGVCKVPINLGMQPKVCWYEVLEKDNALYCDKATGEVKVKIVVEKRILD